MVTFAPTAQEAYKSSLINRNRYLVLIFEKIEEAIEVGETNITIPFANIPSSLLTEKDITNIKDALEEFGYKVTILTQCGRSYIEFSIDWN